MLPVVVGIFFVLHGLVHLLWLVVPWRITAVDGLPYATTVLAGRIDVGDAGIRIVGLLWLLAAIGWVIAGIGVFLLAPWWQPVTIAVALFAAALCILGLPVAKYGLMIDLAVVGFVLLNGRFHWLP
jgi:hypothetical protein